MPFHKLTIRDCKSIEDTKTGQAIFHVCDPHALIQAAGYRKYICARVAETVFFRGQTQIYEHMSPSLFRGCASIASQSGRIGRLRIALSDIRKRCKILGNIDQSIHEPLLQHYGLKTSWIDLVDNVWVALWFACHRPVFIGRLGEYIHFERRNPRKEIAPAYAYVALIASDAPSTSVFGPGHFIGKVTELVDLRLASPSVFLRPHAQHGVLMRVRGDKIRRPVDYSSQVRGILRIDLEDAISWLGDGQMLDVRALFPPPFYDSGYSILLNSGFLGDKAVGTISIVSP